MLGRYGIIHLIAIFLGILPVAFLSAKEVGEPEDPIEIVKQTTSVLLDKVQSKKKEFKENQSSLENFLTAEAMPYWDIDKMIRYCVGREVWKGSTIHQRAALRNAFYETILRYFVSAYTHFSDQAIVFTGKNGFKERSSGWVKSIVRSAILPDVPVDYRIMKDTKKTWRIIDIRVAGISLLQHKKSEFAALLKNNGIDGLINEMNVKNRKVLRGKYVASI